MASIGRGAFRAACGQARGLASEPQIVLGCPTRHSVAVNVFTSSIRQCYVEYAAQPGGSTLQTSATPINAGGAVNLTLSTLLSNTPYHYTLRHRAPGEATFAVGLVV